MGGLFVTYLYNVVDGIFVGQGVGSAALGAVNIGVPFITFSVAAAAMFPMGGATVVAIRMGRGDREGANHAFMTSVALTLLVSVLLTAAGMTFCGQIIGMSGGRTLSGAMRDMAVDYLFYYCAFSAPMLMSTCLSVFVRNDGSPALSFVGMCVGAGANIFLDWLCIFPMGMGVIGAAIASGLGQVFSVAVLLSHFVRRQGRHSASAPARLSIQTMALHKGSPAPSSRQRVSPWTEKLTTWTHLVSTAPLARIMSMHLATDSI